MNNINFVIVKLKISKSKEWEKLQENLIIVK